MLHFIDFTKEKYMSDETNEKQEFQGISEHNIIEMGDYHGKYISNKQDDDMMSIFEKLYNKHSFASKEERQIAYFHFYNGYTVCHMLFNPKYK